MSPPTTKKARYVSQEVAKIPNKQLAKNDIHLSEKKSVPPQQLQKQMQENKV